MSIPRSMMITAESLSACGNPIAAILANDTICAKVPSLLVAVGLLYEKTVRENISFWTPYINCLPTLSSSSLQSLPLFWPHQRMSTWLQASPTRYEYANVQRNAIRQYLHVYTVLHRFYESSQSKPTKAVSTKAANIQLQHPQSWLTFDGFRWAIAIMMTRQNQIPSLSSLADAEKAGTMSSLAANSNEPTSLFALIPAFDFANHRSHGEISTFYNPSTSSTDVATMEPVKKGDSIHIFYG